uniref:Alpha-amylase n=1 Tax=Heterorhabditis bacteriophora TaxID=37862 RepID=A0A1I7XGW1_HETBA
MNMHYLRSSGMNTFTVDYLMWHHFGRRLDECSSDIVRQYRVYFQHLPNPNNLASFIESYVNRTPILMSRDGQSGPQFTVPVLQIIGAGSAFINETVVLNTKLDPSKSDWIKVSDSCGLVLDDRPEAVTESMMLFLQGLGFYTIRFRMQTVDNINDYWGAPVVNWFDYFVDMKKFAQLLDDPVKNKEVIGRLSIQFAEQATNSDKEGEMLIAKTFAQEDVQFSQRKSACLWLHAMSSLAAIDWDFDYLIDKLLAHLLTNQDMTELFVISIIIHKVNNN